MANEKDAKPEAAKEGDAAEAPKKSKKPLLIGGGAAAILALAFVAATFAIPGKAKVRRFEGPFVVALFDDKVNSNLAEEGRKRFLQMNMNVVYEAYEEAYVAARIVDPLYKPFLRDAVLRVNISKNVDQVFDRISMSVYLEEIREAIDPILFPVHFGAASRPTDHDPASGLGPGLSSADSSFRGALDEHVLHVDALAKTIALDDGPGASFAGDETDLELTDGQGRTLFVDVSRLEEGFRGDVQVGVMGRVRRILTQDFLVQ